MCGVYIYLQEHPVMLACPSGEAFGSSIHSRNEQQSRARQALAYFRGSDILQRVMSSRRVQVGGTGGCDEEEGLAGGLLAWPFATGGAIGAISCWSRRDRSAGAKGIVARNLMALVS